MTDKALNQGVSSGHSNQYLGNGMSQVGGSLREHGKWVYDRRHFRVQGKSPVNTAIPDYS